VNVSTEDHEFPEQADDKEIAIKRIARGFRKDTRQTRMAVAQEVQELFERTVSWGVSGGGDTYLFTHATVPAMTRLRIAERQVLGTLVDSGVASSRSEALAWCVKFVKDNETEWLGNLRDAFKSVEQVRDEGPSGSKS
jgi:NH3-dependent NAD+ synthetase